MNEYRRIYTKARKNAAARSIPFDLSWEEMRSLIGEANERCAVTGIPFDFTRLEGLKRRPFGASLDRINSKAGYTKENCRLVCCAVNLALNEWGEDVFRYVAQCLTECHSGKIERPRFSAAQKPARPDYKSIREEARLVWEAWLTEARAVMSSTFKITARFREAEWRSKFKAGASPSKAAEMVFWENFRLQ